MSYNYTKQKQKCIFVREIKVYFQGFLRVLEIMTENHFCLNQIYAILGDDLVTSGK